MFEYFSGNYTWNMAVNTLVEDVGTLSEPSEAFQAVAHLAEANPAVANEAWYQAMVRLGDRLEHMADQDISDGHALSAARKYHRASMYLVRAERMISHEEPKRLATYRRAIANYRKARDLRADGVEFIDIPYRSGYMPALLIRAGTAGNPPPIVVHLQGFDSIKETQFPVLQEYRRRGLSCLIVDQPGAGGALRLHGLTAEIETENYVSIIVDYIQSHPPIATKEIGLAGISMGGYFAPRAAAFEPRIQACAAWGAFYDGGALVNRAPAGNTPAPSVPDPLKHALWVFGVDRPQDFIEIAKKMTLKGIVEKIACPLLVIHGEKDRQVPLQQAIDTFEAATNRNRKLKIFKADEGGVEHCQIDNRALAADYLADWFADTFLAPKKIQ
jgi:alpha-beta hydrolase superfamily lysophospholipase